MSVKTKKQYWVYILEMANGNYYTGYTNDLEKRYQQHLSGTGAKFTRAFKPKKIARAWEVSGSRSLAMKVESYIKQQNKVTKKSLIKNPQLIKELFELP